MTMQPDDPKLTAYALGELDDNEWDEVDTQVRKSEVLRQAVDEIRATADRLTDELASEPPLTMTDAQREAVEAAAGNESAAIRSSDGSEASDTKAKPRSLIFRLRIPIALAASVLLFGFVGYMMMPSLESARSQAKTSRVRDARRGRDKPVTQHYTRKALRPAVPPSDAVAAVNGNTEPLRFGVANDAMLWVQDATSRTNPDASELTGRPDRVAHASTSQSQGGEGGGARKFYVARIDASEVPALIDQLRQVPNNFSEIDGVSFGYEVPHSEEGYSDADGPTRKLGERFIDMPTDDFNTESYDAIVENPFLRVKQNPFSTFSIDVDTASYANVRRMINQGILPPPGAVRIEEMVNYFDYDYPVPTGDDPFSVNVDVANCPWKGEHLLARIGLKGWEVEVDRREPANLVFLLDVSGSMRSPNKLPLVKQSMRMLLSELRDDDTVAIAVYAGASGLVLPAMKCRNESTIVAALDRLHAGGSTNGGQGIQLAYEVATDHFVTGGINRVILCTDGDFNVGVTNQSSLVDLIEEKAESGVFLSVLGFGMGNFNDSTLEKLADKGNGNYAYIDTINEARKVLVDQVGGTLVTIAKDVKIQIDFNPQKVSAFRLIGYENRLLRDQDFNNDAIDAGEIGAGHTVTALYEIVPVGVALDLPKVEPSKYAPQDDASDDDDAFAEPADTAEPLEIPADIEQATFAAQSDELFEVRLRYKQPDGDESKLLKVPVNAGSLSLEDASDDFAFAASVAAFGMLLRNSDYINDFTYGAAIELAETSTGDDPHGYRTEFIDLVRRANTIGDNPTDRPSWHRP